MAARRDQIEFPFLPNVPLNSANFGVPNSAQFGAAKTRICYTAVGNESLSATQFFMCSSASIKTPAMPDLLTIYSAITSTEESKRNICIHKSSVVILNRQADDAVYGSPPQYNSRQLIAEDQHSPAQNAFLERHPRCLVKCVDMNGRLSSWHESQSIVCGVLPNAQPRQDKGELQIPKIPATSGSRKLDRKPRGAGCSVLGNTLIRLRPTKTVR